MSDIGKQINWYGWIFFNKSIPLLSSIVIKYRQRKLRKISRGYNRMFYNHSNNDKKITNLTIIKKELENRVFNEKITYYSPLIFNNALDSAKFIAKHYFLKTIYVRKGYYPALNNEILYYFGSNKTKLIYPLPRSYRDFLKKYGINFHNFLSDIYWYIFIFIFYLIGVFVGFINIIRSLFECIIKTKDNDTAVYVYFNSITTNCLPIKDFEDSNIINWYIKNNKNKEINSICHNIKGIKKITINGITISYKKKIQFLSKFKNLRKYTVWFFLASVLCFIDIFRGRWWHPLLFLESVNASMIKYQNKEKLATEYYFNNSNFLYRPMWTYEAEKKSKIIMSFYSTNLRELNLKNKKNQPLHYYITESTWPFLYVWDNYDKKYFSNNLINKSNIEIKGYIPFENGNKFITNNSSINLSVFDVQPTRDIFYKTIVDRYDHYYRVDNILNFLKIILSLTKFDIKINIKRKRDIGSLAHPQYRNFIKIMEKNEKINLINSEVSALDMIKKSKAVISLPFTSTAHIAKKLNVPSVYFDPSGLIYDNDEALHSIRLINNSKLLEDWIKENFKS